jgi:hypothetical protein
MGVFLRWGVLGILSVAALLYAYNASKRMAEAQGNKSAATQSASALTETATLPDDESGFESRSGEGPAEAISPHCEVELLVARRAIEMRSQPLDRVLRMQEIAWQEPAARRERLETVATRWYGQETPISAEAMRAAVVSDCEQSVPVP